MPLHTPSLLRTLLLFLLRPKNIITQLKLVIQIIYVHTPISDSHLLHRCEYQFFCLEWIWFFGAIGVVSELSVGLEGELELDSP